MLMLLFLIAIGCNQKPVHIEQVKVADKIVIPEIEVDATDSTIQKTVDGITRYGSLFSGSLLSFFDTGQLRSIARYNNGVKEDTTTAFYNNGKIRCKRYYHLGKKHGTHYGWYRNGAKQFEYNFEKGKSEGLHKSWYDTGERYALMNYVNGREFGAQKIWRRDGKIRANYVIRENGKKYGLLGMKRCKKVKIEDEQIDW